MQERDRCGLSAPTPRSSGKQDTFTMSRRLFLERRTYRYHRLQDAARLLPVLGTMLFFGPIFILTNDRGVSGATSGWLIYFYLIWFGLIVLAGVVTTALNRLKSEVEEGHKTPKPDVDDI
ncbi:MAG: hypothetical protein ACJAXT_002164 [Paracoccaceae bacterium]|jgi:hypothetical protein